MVTCSFNQCYGKFIDTDGQIMKVFAGGNCWMVACYECETEEGKHFYQLQLFIDDAQHLKNLIKSHFFRQYIKEIELSKDMPHALNILKSVLAEGVTCTLTD